MGKFAVSPLAYAWALLLPWALLSCGGGYARVEGYAQGGTYRVVYRASAMDLSLEQVRDSVSGIFQHIDTTLSGYNRGSLLSRFNAGEAIRPNALFLDIYRLGHAYWERAGGALDFAAGPLFDAWGFGFTHPDAAMPSAARLDSLRRRCGSHRLPPVLSPDAKGVLDPARLGHPRLNYNAIAQGYTCDLLAAFFHRHGVRDLLVDNGEIWCEGVSPTGKPWSVGVDTPADRAVDGPDTLAVPLSAVWVCPRGGAAGIVTSGNYRKYYVRDGRKYAHTVDPRSGMPVTHNLLSATVVSTQSAADADAVATWCMVVGLDEAMRLVCADATLEAMLIWADEGGAFRHWTSPGFTIRARQ